MYPPPPPSENLGSATAWCVAFPKGGIQDTELRTEFRVRALSAWNAPF